MLPPLSLPIALQVEGFTTKTKDGTVGLRCKTADQMRVFYISRTELISMYDMATASQNLRELVSFLPIYAVVHLNGVKIEQMQTFCSKDEADQHVASYHCLNDDDISEGYNSQTNSNSQNSQDNNGNVTVEKGVQKKSVYSPTPGTSDEDKNDDEIDENGCNALLNDMNDMSVNDGTGV